MKYITPELCATKGGLRVDEHVLLGHESSGQV